MTSDQDADDQERSGADLMSPQDRNRSEVAEASAGFESAGPGPTIERLEKELAGSVELARLASEEMQQVIYAISHDLRAALRSVMSYSQLLQRQPGQSEQAAEFTELIIAGATEMNSFIDDVLVYSRAGSPGRRSIANANALVQWAVMNLERPIRESGAEIQTGELPEINVNESEVVNVFQQLIKNALLFCGEKVPRIVVSATETSEGYVFSVHNNGIGIQPQYHKQIFAPFKRLHGKEVPGRGLGLAICQKIVRCHGGEIWVESSSDQGSTFKFTLPF